MSSEEDGDGDEVKERWTEVLSWEPRAFLYHNFLVGHSSVLLMLENCMLLIYCRLLYV